MRTMLSLFEVLKNLAIFLHHVFESLSLEIFKYIDDVKEMQCVWSHVLRKYTLEDDQNSPRYTKNRFGAPLYTLRVV